MKKLVNGEANSMSNRTYSAAARKRSSSRPESEASRYRASASTRLGIIWAFAIQRVIIRTRALEMQARSAAQRPPELSCLDLAGVGEMPYAALTIYQEIQRYRGGLAAPKCIWRKRWNASRKAETWARRLMILTDRYAIAARRGKLESGLARGTRLRAGLGLGLFGGTERRRKHSRLAKARCVNRL